MNADAEMAKRNRERAAKLQTMAAGQTDAKIAKKLLGEADLYVREAERYEDARFAPRQQPRRKA